MVMSLSEKIDVEAQERDITQAWDRLPRPRPELLVEIMPDGDEAPWKFALDRRRTGPSLEVQDFANRLWLELSRKFKTGENR